MKKISLALAAILLCSSAFSMPQAKNQYGSTLHPLQQATLSDNVLHPPTDITIINATTNYIYATVPYTQVNDYLQPGFNDHIYNYDPNIYWTPIVLKDQYQRNFYSAQVCRLAIVTVTGYTGNYRINNDSDLCN